jgi:hypothetical protein
MINASEFACPDCGGPLGALGFGYGGSVGGKNCHVHGDPAYPPEEALFDLLSHRASPGAVSPDREEPPWPSFVL